VLDAVGFDTAVESYVDMVTQETDVEQVKQNIFQAIRLVRSSYLSGYKTLTKHLGREIRLKALNDPKKVTSTIAKGKALFELLGISLSDITEMYAIAKMIAEEKRYEEAKDAFYFLTSIATTSSECWLCLAITSAHCGEYEEALNACQVALQLAPDKAENYLGLAFVQIQMQDFEAAKNSCDSGLQFAHTHKKEPWAKDLIGKLTDAKEQITIQFEKSQFDCTGS
jgi:tetratricopeptide (TPR) repeat protein